MIEFVSAIHKHVEDSFILDTEVLYNLLNQIQESIPYPICDAEFLSTHCIVEETSYGLIVSKPFGYGKKVILHVAVMEVQAIWEVKLRIWYLPSPRFCLLSLKTIPKDHLMEYIL